GAVAAGGVMGTVGAVAKSAAMCAAAEMAITPPHTEQRARTADPGTFAGSTRKTEWHSGQLTFIRWFPPELRSWAPKFATHPQAGCQCGDLSNRPPPRGSSRSSSSPLQVH